MMSGSVSVISVGRMVLMLLLILLIMDHSAKTCLSHVTISRTALNGIDIITMNPQSSRWLSKYGQRAWNSKSVDNRETNSKQINPDDALASRSLPVQIREVLYLPSPLSLNLCDTYQHATDDDHFCSLLNDKGFIVHVVNSNDGSILVKNNGDFQGTLEEIIRSFVSARKTKHGLQTKHLALIAHELSVTPLLSCLTASPELLAVGALVLLTPPPPPAASSSGYNMRRHQLKVLSRYSTALSSPQQMRQSLGMELHEKQLKKKWMAYLFSVSKNRKVFDFLNSIEGDHNELSRSSIPYGLDLTDNSNLDINNNNNSNMSIIDEAFRKELSEFEAFYLPRFNVDVDIEKAEYLAHTSRNRNSNSNSNGKGKGRTKNRDAVIIPHDIIDKQNSVVNERKVVGALPAGVHLTALGSAMKDRILILDSCAEDTAETVTDTNTIAAVNKDFLFSDESQSTMGTSGDIDPWPVFDLESIYNDFDNNSEQEWGFSASEILSDMLQAGSVINVHPGTADEYSEDDITLLDQNKSEQTDSEEIWTQQDCLRHYRLYRVISDWFDMLKYFGS